MDHTFPIIMRNLDSEYNVITIEEFQPIYILFFSKEYMLLENLSAMKESFID